MSNVSGNVTKGEFVVIETGGKQYRVAAGDTIRIEKLAGDTPPGTPVSFDRVLFSARGDDVRVGTPYLSNASVSGTVTGAGKGKKVSVVKYKAKSRYFKLRGHRQPFLRVQIKEIKSV
jgi:large subunit ribosomal protein L21